MLGCIVFVYLPYPTDDFLRHSRYLDYKPLGGYAYMFPDSLFEEFKFNPWYGFDYMTGLINNYIGKENTIVVYEIVFVCLFFAGLILNMHTSEEDKESMSLTLLLVFLLMSYSLYRVTLIRPSILLSILMLFGLKGKRFLPGVLFSSLCAFFYYLFLFYTVPLSLAHIFRGNKRFGYGLIAGSALSLSAWLLLTDFSYMDFIINLFTGLFNRESITIQENIISLGKITNPIVFLAVVFFACTVYRKRNIDRYLALIIITIPLAIQVRYFLDITLPLMVIYTACNNSDIKEYFFRNKPVFEAVALFAILLCIPPIAGRSIESSSTVRLDDIKIPRGSVVFADNLPLNFSVVFWNKDEVKVIPSAEISWNNTDTKSAVKKMNKGKIIKGDFCDYAEKYDIDYVISELPAEAKCLEHSETFNKRGRRVDLWKVKNQVPHS